jgi:hypothetical protein
MTFSRLVNHTSGATLHGVQGPVSCNDILAKLRAHTNGHGNDHGNGNGNGNANRLGNGTGNGQPSSS